VKKRKVEEVEGGERERERGGRKGKEREREGKRGSLV
jgi:hypothetical protein